MRTFIIRARKGTTQANKILSSIGTKEHSEIIAHTLANAFYFSQGMRTEVEVYLVLESTTDFPRTLHFSANSGLSFPGFHEKAILDVISSALLLGESIEKDQMLPLLPGIQLYGFGFESLIKKIKNQNTLYIMDKKGIDIRTIPFTEQGIFILSDHLSMPKNSIKSLLRQGAIKISLGKKMLFASQCIVLIHNELDRQLIA